MRKLSAMRLRADSRTDPTQVLPPEVPEGAPPWVTPELIAHTLRVWQPFYQAQLIPEDALEIIMSVGRITELLASADGNEAICSVSKGQQP